MYPPAAESTSQEGHYLTSTTFSFAISSWESSSWVWSFCRFSSLLLIKRQGRKKKRTEEKAINITVQKFNKIESLLVRYMFMFWTKISCVQNKSCFLIDHIWNDSFLYKIHIYSGHWLYNSVKILSTIELFT